MTLILTLAPDRSCPHFPFFLTHGQSKSLPCNTLSIPFPLSHFNWLIWLNLDHTPLYDCTHVFEHDRKKPRGMLEVSLGVHSQLTSSGPYCCLVIMSLGHGLSPSPRCLFHSLSSQIFKPSSSILLADSLVSYFIKKYWNKGKTTLTYSCHLVCPNFPSHPLSIPMSLSPQRFLWVERSLLVARLNSSIVH